MTIVIDGTTGISPVTASGTSASVDGMTVGRGAGEVATNTAVGASALAANTTGLGNTSVGYQALDVSTSSDYHTAVGWNALGANTTGARNTAFGAASLATNSTGGYNVAMGVNAGYAVTTGSYNVAIGYDSLSSNTTASNNTAVGYQAGYSGVTAPRNTSIGYKAGYANTTGYNCFIGTTSGVASTGYGNTFVGADYSNGCGALVTSGNNNTIIGGYSGNQGSLDIRTASNYIVLSDGDGNPRGYFDNTGYMYVPTGINATGSYATIASVGATNTMNGGPGTGAWALGVQQNTTSGGGGRCLGIRNVTDFNNGANEFIYCQGNATARFYVLSNGGIYNYSANNVNLSDRREKTNFSPSKSYLDTVCAIPVQTFNYIDQNMEEDGGLTLGVVAQDVQAVAPELVKESNWGTEEEPKMRLSIYQTDLQYALMKSIQELKTIVDAQAAEIAELKAR